jgi:hypothetical protein
MVMIEAMACGTPLIAYRCASVPEIVEEDVSGFLVGTIEEAVAAADRLPELDRARVRAEFERRFTAERMARDYVDIYRQLRAMRHRSKVAVAAASQALQRAGRLAGALPRAWAANGRGGLAVTGSTTADLSAAAEE